MKFILKLNQNEFQEVSFKFGIPNKLERNVIYFQVRNQNYLLTNNSLLLGIKSEFEVLNNNLQGILSRLKESYSTSLFYLFTVEKIELKIFTNVYNLLPIYFYQSGTDILLSSHIGLIIKFAPYLEINKQFILQQNLFNYSFSDETIFNQIKLLPANSYLVFDGKLRFKKFESIENYFVGNPIPWKKSIADLIDLFIQVNKTVIEDGDFVSFTSGFDGRSLIALAHYLKKEIDTFAFGSKENEDLTIPKKQSEILGLPFTPIYLDEEKYLIEYWGIGRKIVYDSGATTNFLQVHWPYSAEIISQKSKNIVSGLFGSELFRAVHLTGQFVSPALVDYFAYIETNEWISKIKNAESLKFLNLNNFQDELEELIDQLYDYRKKVLHLNISQKFYKLIFDDVFRKFFGMQILQPQSEFVNVKIPFMNFDFVTELLQTELAGVNNDFFTQNPLKRFKGQIFYAKFIEKTYPELLWLKTGKGYRPIDLLTSIGKVRIAKNFFIKRFKRKLGKVNLDNLCILSGYQKNRENFNRIPIQTEFYNINWINRCLETGMWQQSIILRDKLIETYSMNLFLNSNK